MLDYLKMGSRALIILVLLFAFIQPSYANNLEQEKIAAQEAVNEVTDYIKRQIAQMGFCFDLNPKCHAVNQYHIDSIGAIMLDNGWDYDHYHIAALLTPNRVLFIRLRFPSFINPDLMYGAGWEIIEKVVPIPIPKKGEKYRVERTGIFADAHIPRP